MANGNLYLFLILVAAVCVNLVSTTSLLAGSDICGSQWCVTDNNSGQLDRQAAINVTQEACSLLVGGEGQYVYLKNERRYVCWQAKNGDYAYKIDFVIRRNKGNDIADNLDLHSCISGMIEILAGTIDCTDQAGWVIGGRVQVGVFDLYATANPGLCAQSISTP